MYTAEVTSQGAILILKDGEINIEHTSSVDFLSQGQQLCNELNAGDEGLSFDDLAQANTHIDLYKAKGETPFETAQIERWLPIIDHISKHADNRKKLRELQLLGALRG